MKTSFPIVGEIPLKGMMTGLNTLFLLTKPGFAYLSGKSGTGKRGLQADWLCGIGSVTLRA
jgi:hypothetical protein